VRRTISARSPVREPTGPEPASLFHVRSVSISKSLDELLFLFPGPNDEKEQHHAADRKQKPICCHQRIRKHGQGERYLKRMPHPAVGAIRDQGMFLPGHNGIREVLAEMTKRPGQQ
jgi:hypothetical protein